MYRASTVDEYVADAAARKPAPGGGSVSALAGALAAAMSEMCANFTAGRKKYAAVADEIGEALRLLAHCRGELLGLMDRDVEAYSAVAEAYALPKETDNDKAERRDAIQQALQAAMAVPLEIMRECARVASVADDLVKIGNRNLITDVGVSAILAEAACAAARLNVEVNLKSLSASDLTEQIVAEMDDLTDTVRASREGVCAGVKAHLAG